MNFSKIKQKIRRNFHKRNPVEVCQQIEEALPEKLAEKLRWEVAFWAPEIYWHNLSVFVNENVKPDSTSEQSIKIYALLCDKTEEEMKQEFISRGH